MTRLHIRWALLVLASVPVWIAARLLAPLVVLKQAAPERAPSWAWWIAPADNDLAGPGADPMWIRWWENDDGAGRAWYCIALRRLGIRSTRHPLVRLLQLWRNGGAGWMYLRAGVRADSLLIVRADKPDGAEYVAYRMDDTIGLGGGREPLASAVPQAWYRTGRAGPLEYLIGWKLNKRVCIAGGEYCKLICTARRAK